MRHLLLLAGTHLLFLSAKAELYIEYPIDSFPLYYEEGNPPEMRALLVSLDMQDSLEIQANRLGPMSIPPAYFFAFQADDIVPQIHSIVRFELAFPCAEEEEVNPFSWDYPPFHLFYLPGPAGPPQQGPPFGPYDRICPPYTTGDLGAPFLVDNTCIAPYLADSLIEATEAHAISRWLGLDLLRIDSGSKNRSLAEWLATNGAGPAWLGLSHENQSGIWSYPDSSLPAYTNWAEWEPHSVTPATDYTMLGPEGLWTTTESGTALLLLEWPLRIDSLELRIFGPELRMAWSAPGELAPGQAFVIHAAAQPWFTPDESSAIGSTTGHGFVLPLAALPLDARWFQVRVEGDAEAD